jgi:hypothetical protein
MCDFISWIEKGGEILFLTGNDVFNSNRGLELQKYCKSKDDLTGHGAIRFFFGTDDKPIQGGTERECTNFSTPAKFPKQIVKAIKKGQMWGFENGLPRELLTAPAYAEYQKVTAPAYAEYNKVTAPAYAEYNKVTAPAYAEYQKVTASAYAEYQKVTDSAYAEYQKVRASAEDEYQKVWAPAYAEYQKVTASAFWKIFADVNNRNPAWK